MFNFEGNLILEVHIYCLVVFISSEKNCNAGQKAVWFPNSNCKMQINKTYYFLIVFSFFEKTTYCCRTRRLSVCPSVRLSVCLSVCLSVRLSSVEIIYFRGISISSMPIDLKISLNDREGAVHV